MVSGVRTVWGIVLIVGGLILIPVPILPGIPMIVAGLVVLLGKDHRAVRAVRGWIEKQRLKRSAPSAAESRD